VRGAFTGAVRDKTGLFELASTGTLFLDEIGEMAPTIQAKLLRALQEGEIRKVGGERNIRVNLAWWRRPTAT
jgi:transcriptional regulator with GAF, ATPase, and Fis domain